VAKLTLKTLTLHDMAKRIRQRMTALEESHTYAQLAKLDESLTSLAEVMLDTEEGKDEDEMTDEMYEAMGAFVDACRPLPRKRDKRQR
jgi:hypothetical protein